MRPDLICSLSTMKLISPPKGIDFTAQYGDHNFVIAHPPTLKAIVERVKAAAAGHGRTVGTYALLGLIIAPTDAEDKAMGDHIIAGADEGAIGNILTSAAMDTNVGGTADRIRPVSVCR